jgi:Zn ribbon nucleic-acid-binding protein
MSDLLPFNADAKCPKCGSTDIGAEWIRNRTDDYECMERTCSCGYTWFELPADAQLSTAISSEQIDSTEGTGATEAPADEWVEVEDDFSRFARRRFSRDGKYGELWNAAVWLNVGPGDVSLAAFRAGLHTRDERGRALAEAVTTAITFVRPGRECLAQVHVGNLRWQSIRALAREYLGEK